MNTFCLVALNSQYVHTNLAVRLIKNLDKSEDTVVLEHTINNQMDYVLEDIISRRPKCVVFSCYIWNIEYVKQLTGSIKKVLPDTIIVLAGPEVSYGCSEIINENPYFDVICFGEGETIYPQLKNGILKNDLSAVEGICYRENNKIITNPIAGKFDINTQIFPYYDIEDVSDRILYFETSRGCPFKCSYCISGISGGVEFMSLENVEKHFETFFKHNANQVKLVDRTFNYPVKRAVSIVEIMLKLKAKYPGSRTSFHCELNPLLITKEFAELLKSAPKGFLQFEIGVQSTNPETLQAIMRDVNLKKQHENIEMLTGLENITVYVDLIAGLPFETYGIFKNSFNDIYKMNADKIHLGFLKVLKGSHMQKTAADYGIIYCDYAPYKVLKTSFISFEELSRLEKIESLVDTYFNSDNFASSLIYFMQSFDSPFDFYSGLCDYLQPRDYFNRPHKFVYYYEVLYDFITSKKAAEAGMAEAVLLHDFCCNSRPRVYPGFAKNVHSQNKKDSAREFYNKEENIQKYLPHYNGISPSTISRQCNIEFYEYDVTSPALAKGETVILYDYSQGIQIHKIN